MVCGFFRGLAIAENGCRRGILYMRAARCGKRSLLESMTMNAFGSNSPSLLLTAKQAAETLSISTRKLWSLTAAGEIPHVRIGRSVRYPVDALKNWIDEQQSGGRR